MRYFIQKFFLAIVILLTCHSFVCVAQITITGKVTDAETGEPLPYVNIVIPGKFYGTSTTLDGTYTLEVKRNMDSLSASFLGYETVTKKINEQQNQMIDFELKPESKQLREIIVSAGERPEITFMQRVIREKPKNDPYNFKTLQYESYNKYQINLDNVSARDIEKNLLLRNLDFLQDYLDTLSEKGKSSLPLFLIEQVSDNYEQSDPKKVVERVKGQKMTLLRDNPLITEMMSNANQKFNIYENLMNVMGRNFVSPIADYGLSVYDYDMNYYDTLFIAGEPHFTVEFKPKRKGDNAFSGEMMVNIHRYAVVSIEATIPAEVNIGFINDFHFTQEFVSIPIKMENSDSLKNGYVPSRESVKMRISNEVGKGSLFIIRKSKSFRHLRANEPVDENVFDAYNTTVVNDTAYERDEIFWDTVRHEKLHETEAGIYEMVDSLKRTSKYKIIKYSLTTLSSGHLKTGPVSFGHIATIFSRNDVEGWRFKLGVKTNRDFSERVNLSSYLAYGVDDNRFKYGGKMIFIISKRPWHKITFSGRSDIDMMSRHAEEMDHDNIFTIVQKKGVPQRLYNIVELKGVYDNEFHKDLTTYLTLQYRELDPYFNIYIDKEGQLVQKIFTSEIGYALRWQHRSESLPGTYERDAKANRFFAQFRKKTEFPVVWIKYLTGLPRIFNSNFQYHDVSFGLQGDITITAKQSLYYNAWIGKIIGEVPFLLLKNPEGNFSHVFNKYMFNNMNLLEFSADEYASLNFQYFFGGWIGDHIPLVKKLKLRAVATTNIFYGSLSDENRELNALNDVSIAYPVPYVEAGFGIENILKFLRIDCIWRVTHRDKPGAYKFGVYASLYFKV